MPWLDRGRSRLKDLGKMLRQLLTLLLVLGNSVQLGHNHVLVQRRDW